ncbi:MAG: RNA polymerase sigma factor [Aeromicrobium sp.]
MMTEDQPSDAEVVRASFSEPSGFAELWHRHASDLHRFATRRIGPSAADDVAAETFEIAFRTRERFDMSRTSARPWLYGIAANLIGKHRRSEVRALRAVARAGRDPVVGSWIEQTDERIDAVAARQPLAAALATLSPGDRHVLLLVAWADFSYLEVAEALTIPLGTVRSRLHRARRRIRSTIDPDVVAGSGEPEPENLTLTPPTTQPLTLKGLLDG